MKKDKDYPRNTLTPEMLERKASLAEEADSYSEFATNALIMDECYLQNKNLMEEIQVMEAKIDVDDNHK